METLYFDVIDSPVGELALGVSEKGLVRLSFGRDVSMKDGARVNWERSAERVRPYTEQLRRYFRGELQRFTLPLDLRGTAFQRKVWESLYRIPFGEVRTYGDVARAVGNPKACRAVGGANHENPVCIVVPCHRVIASGNRIGGFGARPDIKEKLLVMEGAWPLAKKTKKAAAGT